MIEYLLFTKLKEILPSGDDNLDNTTTELYNDEFNNEGINYIFKKDGIKSKKIKKSQRADIFLFDNY